MLADAHDHYRFESLHEMQHLNARLDRLGVLVSHVVLDPTRVAIWAGENLHLRDNADLEDQIWVLRRVADSIGYGLGVGRRRGHLRVVYEVQEP